MTNSHGPKVIAHGFKMAQKRGFPLVRRADWACGGRSVGMTPIRSALKTGPPRSKGYRLQTCLHRQSALRRYDAWGRKKRRIAFHPANRPTLFRAPASIPGHETGLRRFLRAGK